MDNWFVYILLCADNSLYTGITTDLQRRLQEHNDSSAKSAAKFTRGRQPVTLVYQEMASNRSEASKRELAIKSLSKNQKQLLIDGSVKINIVT